MSSIDPAVLQAATKHFQGLVDFFLPFVRELPGWSVAIPGFPLIDSPVECLAETVLHMVRNADRERDGSQAQDVEQPLVCDADRKVDMDHDLPDLIVQDLDKAQRQVSKELVLWWFTMFVWALDETERPEEATLLTATEPAFFRDDQFWSGPPGLTLGSLEDFESVLRKAQASLPPSKRLPDDVMALIALARSA